MPRVSIDLPDTYRFRTDIAVLLSHINYANHLCNTQVLALAGEARLRFLRSLGYASDLEIEGVGLVVADHAVQYRSEAFYGETMVIELDLRDFSRCGCDLVWRMSDLASGREVARGKTGLVFFDYATRTVAPVPAGLRARWPDGA